MIHVCKHNVYAVSLNRYNSILFEYVLIVHIVYLQDCPISLFPFKGPLIDQYNLFYLILIFMTYEHLLKSVYLHPCLISPYS